MSSAFSPFAAGAYLLLYLLLHRDPVCSVGLIPHRRPFTQSGTTVRTFRHALSLDERRAKFKANHFNRPSESGPQQGTKPDTDVKEVWFAGYHHGEFLELSLPLVRLDIR